MHIYTNVNNYSLFRASRYKCIVHIIIIIIIMTTWIYY